MNKLYEVIIPPVGETAPAIICILTQRINAYRDRCFAIQDYSAAIENMLLALVELGYQSCFQYHVSYKATDFKSYFLTFDDGARLEIMNKPVMDDFEKSINRTGFMHIAFSVGSKEKVDELL